MSLSVHVLDLRRLAVTGAAFALALAAGQVAAANQEFTCQTSPANTQTGTFVFHPKRLGIDANEDDGPGDVSFEHRFRYEITVTGYDTAKPGWTGPEICSFTGGWDEDTEINISTNGYWESSLHHIVYLHKVPRDSKVHVHFWGWEWDAASDNETLDFNAGPGNDVDLDVFVADGTGRTMVGAAAGHNDLQLNHAKRLIGNGTADTRAYLEFVVNMHMDPAPPVVANPNLLHAVPMVPGALLSFDNTAFCQGYADKAVALTGEAEKLGCGFVPPVWSKNGQMHFEWCKHGDNAKIAASQNVQRAADLQACAAQKASQPQPNLALCTIYAGEATAHAIEAQKLGCGFFGPRWSADFAAHAGWCMAGADPAVMIAETASRASEIAACAAAKGGN